MNLRTLTPLKPPPERNTSVPTFAVLTAAGSGTRLGAALPKALVPVGDVPMLVRAAQGLADAGVAGIVVTAPAERIDDFSNLVTPLPGHPDLPVEVVAGGASRQASVAAGMAALPALAQRCGATLGDSSVVLVHDAARCLTPPVMIERVIAAVKDGCEAVIPALAVTDTVKQVASAHSDSPAGTEPRYVVATPDRSTLVSVQTPQGFRWSTLQAAHEAGRERGAQEGTAATDDAGLVEAMGGRVHVVEGDGMALKITTTKDLLFVEAMMKVLERRHNNS